MKTKVKKERKVDLIAVLLLVAIIVVSVLSVNCYIEKYETTYKAMRLQNEYEAECNEGELLNIEYRKRANYRQIKSYVSENFQMKKLEDYQYEYVKNGEGDKMVALDNDKNSESFTSSLSKTFSVILEYFN